MHNLTRPDGTEPEDLLLSRRAVTSMFFAGYAVTALSAEAAPIVTPADGLTGEEVHISNGTPTGLPAFVARPTGKSRHATIVVVNEIFGIHDYIKDICRRLARLGYAAVAPDFFYRSGVNLPALSDMAEIRAIVAQAGEAQVDGDLRAATAWIAAQRFSKPKAIGVTGFCWGGLVTWRAAMTNPDVRAGVAWYGQLKTVIPRAGELKAPVLGLYGGKDKGIPAEDVRAMGAALDATGKTGSSIHLYPGAEHGFHADYRPSYDAAAAADGWARMLAFFKSNGVA
ncbi:dienelactone hydrolase family protein [Sphingomonas sp. ID0503]|uniref:dienelactone hydrolase family protein n=1 Tax=Sphingomonas sp. ID0503 TaxID=3399691 RepID=UPI003AFB1893